MDDLPSVGDRIIVSNSEFSTWLPTPATVIKRSVRFRASEEFRQHTVTVRLDAHPFPEVIMLKVQDLTWEAGHPTITWELEDAA